MCCFCSDHLTRKVDLWVQVDLVRIKKIPVSCFCLVAGRPEADLAVFYFKKCHFIQQKNMLFFIAIIWSFLLVVRVGLTGALLDVETMTSSDRPPQYLTEPFLNVVGTLLTNVYWLQFTVNVWNLVTICVICLVVDCNAFFLWNSSSILWT